MLLVKQLAWKYMLGTTLLLLALALLIQALRIDAITLNWRSARAEVRYAGPASIPTPSLESACVEPPPTPTPLPPPSWVEEPMFVPTEEPPTPFPTSPYNLIRDSNFESSFGLNEIFSEGLVLPSGWTTHAFRDGAVFASDFQAHSGQYSARIDASETNDAGWLQTVPVSPHTNYHLSGWIKTQDVANGNEPVQMGANLSLSGSWVEHTPGLTGTNDWTYVELYFNSDSRTEVTVACRLGYMSGTALGTMWCDDIELRPQVP